MDISLVKERLEKLTFSVNFGRANFVFRERSLMK